MELRLYPGGKPATLAIEDEEAVERDESCALCKLHTDAVRSPCINAEGEPGGLLLIGEAPGRNEDATGRPFFGKSGQLLRRHVAKHWRGPVAFDNAIRCAPGRTDVRPKMLDKCRRYLAYTWREVKPERIVCLGASAAYSVTGRNVAPMSTRRGYTYLSDGTPVFFVLHPAAALRNRFVMEWFASDLEWALTADPSSRVFAAKLAVIMTRRESEEAVRSLREAPWAAFDVETAGVMWTESFEVISLAACAADATFAYTWDSEALADPEVAEPLFDWLRDPECRKVGQNVKFDLLACRAGLDLDARGVDCDTRLLRKLLAPEADAKLETLAELVGMGGLKQEKAQMQKIVSTIKRNLARDRKPLHPSIDPVTERYIRLGIEPERFMYKLLPPDDLARYNARDSVATGAVAAQLMEQLSQDEALSRVWHDTVVPAAQALVEVEGWGIAVDRANLDAFTEHLELRLVQAKQVLSKWPDVNWNSTPQLRKLLFEDIGLPVLQGAVTGTGLPSTNAKTLKRLAKRHELPAALLDFRTVTKLYGTYAKGMYSHIRDDGRIHPNIKLDGARSGRTSCVDPNLQNIPRSKDSPEGKMARDVFCGSPGHVLVELDYSQLELRVAAILSGDPLMRAIFQEGVDYHQRTAEMISQQAWGIAPELVESKHRTQAKTINFALLYGMADKTLAEQMGVPTIQATRIRESILGKFKHLDRWCRQCLRDTRKTGNAHTWWDGQRARTRPLWRVVDVDSESRSRAEHGSWNTPVQGTASDFLVKSLTRLVQWIVEEGLGDVCKLVLPVHDSVMYDVREDMVDEVLAVTKEIMSSWPSEGVPLVVDAKVGRTWGSLEDV